MEKAEKHQKAVEFRNRITFPEQRKCAISELIEKKSYSEADQIRLGVLFQKTSYLEGCEHEYRLLIAKIKGDSGVAVDRKKISSFEAKLH